MSVNVATADEESLRNGIKNLVRCGDAAAEMFPRMGAELVAGRDRVENVGVRAAP